MKNFFFCLLFLSGFYLIATAQEASPKGYIEMPLAKDGSYIFNGKPGDNRRWGKPETIKSLMLVAREWNRKYQGKYKIRIGDISKKDGSDFPPHKTHKDGLRIDITTSPNICHITFKDQSITTELAQLFVRFGAWRIYYNHPNVITSVKEVKPLEKHDDHFHVEIDPKKVPQNEGPFVIAAPPVAENGWVGSLHAKKEGEGWMGTRLEWAYLGADALWQKSFQVDLSDEKETILHSSKVTESSKLFYRLAYPLEDEKNYKWRVNVVGKNNQTLTTGWIPFRTDFTPPQVSGISPKKDEEMDSRPTFTWKYEDSQSKQHSFILELDKDDDHTKLIWRSAQEISAKEEFTLPMDLPTQKTYYWRVIVFDGRGNSAMSDWISFHVDKKKKIKLTPATVNSKSLNLRKGPGTSHGVVCKLSQGQKVYIVEKQNDWLKVRFQSGNSIMEGYVHKDYVKED
jgi:hypothetical protein